MCQHSGKFRAGIRRCLPEVTLPLQYVDQLQRCLIFCTDNLHVPDFDGERHQSRLPVVFVLAKMAQGFVHRIRGMKQNPKAEMKFKGGSILIWFGSLWVFAALLALPAGEFAFAAILLLVGGIFIAFGSKTGEYGRLIFESLPLRKILKN